MKNLVFIVIGAAILIVVAGSFLSDKIGSPSNCEEKGSCMLYFCADGCAICERMDPIVGELGKKYGRDFTIHRVDADSRQGKELARQYGCFGQPTFILFDKSGNQVRKLMGAQTVEMFEREIERILGE